MRPIPLGLCIWLAAALFMYAQPICAQPNQELSLRAAWLHGTSCTDAAKTNALLDRAEAANLNALFPLVFYWGATAFYKSNIVPMNASVAPGFDPLGHLVQEGRRRGIEIHAWFVNGSNQASSWVFDAHPEWRATNSLGDPIAWFDLCQPDVRRWQADVMLEVLQKYDVDGVHFDYIRFPDKSVCYGLCCRTRALEDTGVDIDALIYKTLPAYGHFRGNPLADPTTAQILAVFDNGEPAVALNRLGGQVVLFNWHAQDNTPQAVNIGLYQLLRSWGLREGDEVRVLDSDINAARYTRQFYERARDWISRLGFRPVRVTDSQLLSLPARSAIVLPNHYLMTDAQARSLIGHISGGGNALFIDGPVFALAQSEAARQLLGFARAGRFFNEERLILPQSEIAGFLPTSGRMASIEQEREAHAAWDRWRKNQISALVVDVHDRVKAAKPDRYVTAAVFYTQTASESVLQDWSAWLRQGKLDYAIPMSYVTDPDALRQSFAWWRNIDPGLVRIVPSLSVYQVGADLSPQGHAEAIAPFVNIAKAEGAGGFVLFRLELLRDETARILGQTVFSTSGATGQPAPGDFDSDGVVAFKDFILFASHYGKSAADPGYDSRFDLDGDGKINFADFIIFAGMYR